MSEVGIASYPVWCSYHVLCCVAGSALRRRRAPCVVVVRHPQQRMELSDVGVSLPTFLFPIPLPLSLSPLPSPLSLPLSPPTPSYLQSISLALSQHVLAGQHCSEAACKALDFLPFKCASCSRVFCLEHRSLSAHKCHASDVCG